MIQNGNMGNPDINCNVHVKFGALRENVLQRYGPETWLATGHYARLWHPQLNDKSRPTTTESLPPVTLQNYSSLIEQNLSLEDDDWLWRFHSRCQSGDTLTPWLLGAADLTKDQSYFLAGCKGSQLRQVLFPLGDLYKKSPPRTSTQQNLDQADQDTAAAPIEREDAAKTVREIAAELNLPTANKRESMGICFIGKRKSWKQFVQDYVPRAERKVDFVDIDSGKVLAQSDEPSHPAFYTAGQGARLSGTPEKYFVVGPVSSPPSVLLASSSTRITSNDSVMPQSKEERNNVVWICAGTQHPALFAKHFTVHSFNWILETVPEPLLKLGGVLRCQCRIRHLQRLANCEVVRTENSEGRDGHYTIHLEEPMRGIMPGQMLVLYAANGLVCLGGGPITSRGPSLWEQNKMHKV
uniref:tRNA-specific 2-thiouridylase MnmA-like C-terminal domain-containing protein n=1 Tax=Entomoneis paludosa TaxID=265537 RepID=A0A7S2YCD8_9STRA